MAWRRFSGDKRFGEKHQSTRTGYEQVTFGILNAHIEMLAYASESEQDHQCKKCRTVVNKWLQVCPACGNPMDQMFTRLVQSIVFCESQFALDLCTAVDFDYLAYIKRSQVLFDRLDRGIKAKSLRATERWWEEHGENTGGVEGKTRV